VDHQDRLRADVHEPVGHAAEEDARDGAVPAAADDDHPDVARGALLGDRLGGRAVEDGGRDVEPGLVEAVRTFSERTLGFQLDRESPFSVWGWGQYHARGLPDLAVPQKVLQVGVLALAGVAAVLPRRKGPLELAALTAAILIGFELALTHWFYLYLPWFLPFVLLALLVPRTAAGAR